MHPALWCFGCFPELIPAAADAGSRNGGLVGDCSMDIDNRDGDPDGDSSNDSTPLYVLCPAFIGGTIAWDGVDGRGTVRVALVLLRTDISPTDNCALLPLLEDEDESDDEDDDEDADDASSSSPSTF